jgi:hypothetical protein
MSMRSSLVIAASAGRTAGRTLSPIAAVAAHRDDRARVQWDERLALRRGQAEAVGVGAGIGEKGGAAYSNPGRQPPALLLLLIFAAKYQPSFASSRSTLAPFIQQYRGKSISCDHGNFVVAGYAGKADFGPLGKRNKYGVPEQPSASRRRGALTATVAATSGLHMRRGLTSEGRRRAN